MTLVIPSPTGGRGRSREMPKRRFVKVARMRLADAEEGDIVNRHPEAEEGWFAVAKKHRLFNGDIQLSDTTADNTVSGKDFEIVGVQFVSDAEVPEQPPIPAHFLVFNDGSEEPGPDSADDDDGEELESAEPAQPIGVEQAAHA